MISFFVVCDFLQIFLLKDIICQIVAAIQYQRTRIGKHIKSQNKNLKFLKALGCVFKKVPTFS